MLSDLHDIVNAQEGEEFRYACKVVMNLRSFNKVMRLPSLEVSG